MVVGWWQKTDIAAEEDQAYADHLNKAVQGHELTSNERFQELSDEIELVRLDGETGDEFDKRKEQFEFRIGLP